MRILILSILLCCGLLSNIKAQQCDTYIQMVLLGVDGCGVLPQVVATQEFLFPCSTPAGWNQLEEGDFAYIEYIDSGCINICQAAPEVNITCLNFPVGIVEEKETDDEVLVFPAIVQDWIYIEGDDILQVEIYNEWGVRMMLFKEPDVSGIDIGFLGQGIYFITVSTRKGIRVRKVVKL